MFNIIMSIVLAIVSILMIITIFLQEPKEQGLGAGLVGGNESTNWKRRQKYSRDAQLSRITVVLAIIFFVIAILLNIPFFANL